MRPLIDTSIPNMGQAKRDKLSDMVGRLCVLRIDSDYRPSESPRSGHDFHDYGHFRRFLRALPIMPTPAEVPGIVAEVRQRLAEASNQGIHLEVITDKLEDDWLYVVVAPSRPGVRALDHANTMSKIERELRKQGIDRLLLVPTLED